MNRIKTSKICWFVCNHIVWMDYHVRFSVIDYLDSS